jgi:hypothetical protein
MENRKRTDDGWSSRHFDTSTCPSSAALPTRRTHPTGADGQTRGEAAQNPPPRTPHLHRPPPIAGGIPRPFLPSLPCPSLPFPHLRPCSGLCGASFPYVLTAKDEKTHTCPTPSRRGDPVGGDRGGMWVLSTSRVAIGSTAWGVLLVNFGMLVEFLQISSL